jgi:hypothetical protein
MRDKYKVSFSPIFFATPVIAGYCDAGTMYANIPAPFHPALATLLPALAASMAFEIQSIFHIIDI